MHFRTIRRVALQPGRLALSILAAALCAAGCQGSAPPEAAPATASPSRQGVPPTVARAHDNDAAFVRQTVPTSMKGGAPTSVSITMRNKGKSTWSSADRYELGSTKPEDTLVWGVARANLSAPVKPGEEVTFDFKVTPTTPGRLTFSWRMVQETVEWFGEGSTAVSVRVTR